MLWGARFGSFSDLLCFLSEPCRKKPVLWGLQPTTTPTNTSPQKFLSGLDTAATGGLNNKVAIQAAGALFAHCI